MSTLKEESARRAGLAGAKNNTRGALDRPGTRLLRLRPTLSPHRLPRGVGAVEQRSVVEADRLLVLLLLWRRAVVIGRSRQTA